MIIGISGKMGSGKDYYADKLLKKFVNSIKICFADQLKVIVATKYNIDIKLLFGDKTQEHRELLQETGQDERKIDKKIWIKYTNNWIKLYQMRGFKYIIISDVRYKNEANYIKQKGGIVIRIHAPKRNLQRLQKENSNGNHISEIDLDDYKFDYTINNNS